jgi:uncharacterized protein
MLLAREFITYLSRQIVRRLSPGFVETPAPQRVVELIDGVISEDLQIEDRLNDEVREILGQYTEYMRREGVSYQDMFRKAKNTLIAQRKIVRASGRDTGDNMKLSRDKVTEISHKIIIELKKFREVRLRKDTNEIRLAIVKAISEILLMEEKAERAARDKIRSQKRDIPEGTEEWDLLHRRYYGEELKKLGIDVNS